jgi:hypothetical protein
MTRSTLSFTEAVRNLLDQYGEGLTHEQARPMLRKMGVAIANDPPERTDDYRAWEKVAKGYHKPDWNDAATVKAFYAQTTEEAGLKGKAAQAVIDMAEATRPYLNERNSFDVCKYNWKKSRTTGSSKPVNVQANAKSQAAAKVSRKAVNTVVVKPRPKHRPAVVGDDEYAAAMEAMKFIEQNGGLDAVKTRNEKKKEKLATLREQLQNIQQQVETLEAETIDIDAKVDLTERLLRKIKRDAA